MHKSIIKTFRLFFYFWRELVDDCYHVKFHLFIISCSKVRLGVKICTQTPGMWSDQSPRNRTKESFSIGIFMTLHVIARRGWFVVDFRDWWSHWKNVVQISNKSIFKSKRSKCVFSWTSSTAIFRSSRALQQNRINSL